MRMLIFEVLKIWFYLYSIWLDGIEKHRICLEGSYTAQFS